MDLVAHSLAAAIPTLVPQELQALVADAVHKDPCSKAKVVDAAQAAP